MPQAKTNLSESKRKKTTETKKMLISSRKPRFHQRTTKGQTVIAIINTMMKKARVILNMVVSKIEQLL
jgi:ribosomal protein L18